MLLMVTSLVNAWVRTMVMPQVTHKLCHTMLYRAGFELTTLVVIDTYYIGSYKSNYHMVTTTTARVNACIIVHDEFLPGLREYLLTSRILYIYYHY